ncbi:GAF and ANTAR domain-containing protein [Saccharomonospora sp. NPDC006951]
MPLSDYRAPARDTPRAPRVETLARTFAELADVVAPSFDEHDYVRRVARRCGQLLDIDEAALAFADPQLRTTALGASSEAAHELMTMQVHTRQGPSADCLRGARASGSADLREENRWAAFTTSALNAGFVAAHALPLCSHGRALGVLTLLRRRPGTLGPTDTIVATALAQAAASAVLSQRTLGAAQRLAGQLQTALHTRIDIEQAKGLIAAHRHSDMDVAFEVLREHARSSRRRLHDVAKDVIDNAPRVRNLLADGGGP